MEILLASNNKNKHKELSKIFQESGSRHTLIVNKDIPEYEVHAGIPAKKIGERE